MSSNKFIARNGLAVGTTPVDIVDSTGTILVNAPTATKLQTARTISLSGDVAGSVSFDGTGNVAITTTIQPDSVALGTDTTGNYMVNVSAGTGVSVSHTQGEGSTATVSIGQPVGTTDNVTFNNVTVNGTLTSDDITSTNISVAGNATITGNLTVSGTTTTVNSTTVAIADLNLELAKNATTAAQANGAGITIDGPATPATLTYSSSDDRWNFNKNLNVTTVYGALSGNASTASTWQTARTLSYTGDVTGSMSVNGSADVSTALTLANSGVTAGTYNNVTVDAKGRVTSGSNASYASSTHYHDRIYNGAVGTSSYVALSSTNELEYYNAAGVIDTLYLQYSGTAAQLKGPGGAQIWMDSNDGSGSGLDADLLDGNHASAFALAGHTHSYLSAESDTLATVTGRGATTSTVTSFTGGGGDGLPALRINQTSAAGSANWFGSFINSGLNASAGKFGLILLGQAESAKNSGYLGFQWQGAGSNSNAVTLGLYAADNLLKVYGAGYTEMSGSARAPIFYDSDNTAAYANLAQTSGTIIATGASSDTLGYNPSYGIYIGGINGRYLYSGNSSYTGPVFHNGSSAYTVYHSGNLTDLNQLTNGPGYITGGYLDDYTRGAYRVIADYSSTNTWYIRSNGRFTWARGHDWTQAFELNIGNGTAASNNGWAEFGQNTSNNAAGTWFGTRFVQYTGSAKIDGYVRAGRYYLGDDTNYITGGGSGAMRSQTSTGYVDVGSMNASYAHIQTDRPQFYFNKDVYIDGQLYKYGGGTYLHSNNYNSYAPTLTGGNASGTWSISITGSAGDIGGYRSDGWLRKVSDSTQFQMYGNSRTMIYRTDGTTNPHGGGAYAHIFYYGGSADADRKFIINTDGRLYSPYHGWLDTMSISGNAGSVSGLTLTSSSNGINPDNVTQNQIGYNTSVSLFGQTDGGLYSSAYSSSWIHQIYGDFRTGQIAIRGKNSGTWQSWRTVLDTSNYTSYTMSRDNWNGNLYFNNDGRIYSTIMYDANDSGYYTDANSTSRFNVLNSNTINVQNGYSCVAQGYNNNGGFAMNNSGTYWGLMWNYASNDWRLGWGSTTAQNGWGMRWDSSGNAWSNSSHRSPVFYDNDNTGYYFDGNNTSVANHIVANRIKLYNNYGHSIFGVYSSYRYQGVWSMGESWYLPDDGTTTGNLYGLCWSHPNAGGTAGNLNTHGLLVLENGGFLAAVSGSIRSRDDMRTPIYYDNNNTGYYADLNGTTYCYYLQSATTIRADSDARLKDNIVTLENSLNKVMKLRGVTYTRKDLEDKTKKHIGLIAQEVLEVIPEVVGGSESAYYSVGYAELVPVLVEAIKEQQSEIDELKALVKQLLAK